MQNQIFEILLYKAKQVKLCCCKNIFVVNFPKHNYKAAMRFGYWWCFLILVFYGLEVVITGLDLAFTQKHVSEDKSHHHGVASEAFRTEFEYWYLDALQIGLTLLVIYMLGVF